MGVAYSLGQGCKKCNVSVDLLLYCFYACVTCILVHFLTTASSQSTSFNEVI